MRKRITLACMALMLVFMAAAQSLNVATGSINWNFKADGSDMTYSDGGRLLTIGGKLFAVSDISQITFGQELATEASVTVSYSEGAATVVVAGDIAPHLSITVNGADVDITQDADVDTEITYTLTGSTSAGSLRLSGSYKTTIVLDGLSLRSTHGPAIDIENGKRINVVVADGTHNTLADTSGGSHKACFYVKGHAEFSSGGSLEISGLTSHAFRSKEYTLLKKSFGSLRISSAKADGMHIGQYFEMRGGEVTIAGVAGDGLQVECTTDDNGTALVDEENTGTLTVTGGTLTVSTDATDAKAIKADSAIVISGGNVTLTATGAGSKGASTNGTIAISGGKICVTCTGGLFAEGTAEESKPHGMKADGGITIAGGEVYVACQRKAFSTDATFKIDGGRVLGIGTKASADDTGTQGSTTYRNVMVASAQTLTYGIVSYTLPQTYSCSSARILVSPKP